MTINDTPCKQCCFAIYEDLTQTGCARNRIEKYKRKFIILLCGLILTVIIAGIVISSLI